MLCKYCNAVTRLTFQKEYNAGPIKTALPHGIVHFAAVLIVAYYVIVINIPLWADVRVYFKQ
jgi:hypothetical protein